jgi:hypothetical protein
VVVQHPEGGIEDGHEVVFQTPGPKRTISDGGDSTYWRMGTSGSTRSTRRWAASCTLRGGRRACSPFVRRDVPPARAKRGLEMGYLAGSAARTEPALLARERQCPLGAAVTTSKPDKPMLRITAGQQSGDGLLYEPGDRASGSLHRFDVGGPPFPKKRLENTLGRVAGNVGSRRLHPRAPRRWPGQSGRVGISPGRIRIPSAASGFRMRRRHFGPRRFGIGSRLGFR